MVALKTQRNKASVAQFIEGIEDEVKREDCKTLIKIMHTITKAKAKMWGDSIIGFGSYNYKYKSEQEGTWFLTGFSPRKQNLTLYIMGGFSTHKVLLGTIGKCKTSKVCLYTKTLEDIHLPTLKKLIKASVKKYPNNYAHFSNLILYSLCYFFFF
jgi:hypothetical protein